MIINSLIKCIYLLVTNNCNLNCRHCYHFNDPQYMTYDIALHAVKYIRLFAKRNKNNRILVIFHGGEPMLEDISILNYIYDLLSNTDNIDFSITTNLVYAISDEKFRFLKKIAKSFKSNWLIKSDIINELNVIGTSWDYKIRFKNDAEKLLWENNVRYLISNGIMPAPIITVTRELMTEVRIDDLLAYFKKLGIKMIDFNKLLNIGNGKDLLCISNHEYDQWILKAYIESKKQDILIRKCHIIENRIKNASTDISESCSTRNAITILANGDISLCVSRVSDKKNIISNIYSENELPFFQSDNCNECMKNKFCYMCKYYVYCENQCNLITWDDECPGLKMTIEYCLLHLNKDAI